MTSAGNLRSRLRRHVTAVRVAMLACAVLTATSLLQAQANRTSEHWVGTWATAATLRAAAPAGGAQNPPQVPNTPAAQVIQPAVVAVAPSQQLTVGGQSPLHFNNQTLRQIAHVSIGGSRARVVLTNALSTAPLVIGAAQVALRDKDASIVAQSSRPLTFGGSATTTIPPGAVAFSDAVNLTFADMADLAIDIYLPNDTAEMKSPLTTHAASWQTNYVSQPGNHVGVAALPVQTTTAYRRGDGLPTATSFFLARVEVMAPAQVGAIVALGDSITDGTHSGVDTNSRWPDHLARRLLKAGIRMAVLNAGIGGNRVLGDGAGPGALARFDRDVLGQSGVTHVIVLEGINDIGGGRENVLPRAEDLIAAHKQLIERAHARGLKIYGATLTPFEGANYWTTQGEAKRQALNDWIRMSKAYDGFFDFDKATRDPSHPTKALPQFDPGDHLHLTPAGYEAVANSIDLAVFRSTAAAGAGATR